MDTLGRHDEKGNVNGDNPSDSSIDMLVVLCQITIKVPLSKLLRILEHWDKAIAWLGITNVKVSQECNENHVPKEVKKEKVKEHENEVVVSQIPQMFLDNSVNECLGNVKPFFLSILVNDTTLKNFLIDSGASSTVMPFEIMKVLGLKVDTTQGR